MNARRGIALPLVLVVLAVVTALATMSLRLALSDFRLGRAAVAVQQALAAAEAGVAHRLASWGPAEQTLVIGATLPPVDGSLGASGWYRTVVVRLNSRLLFIRAEGFSADSTARQQLGLLVREAGSGVVRLRHRSWLNLY